MQYLFSYGTLQQINVQLDTFGRELEGEKDQLIGFKVGEIEITDEAVIKSSGKRFHPILIKTDNNQDTVDGTVFKLTDDELAKADSYEVNDYTRMTAKLKSGITTWIYAAA